MFLNPNSLRESSYCASLLVSARSSFKSPRGKWPLSFERLMRCGRSAILILASGCPVKRIAPCISDSIRTKSTGKPALLRGLKAKMRIAGGRYARWKRRLQWHPLPMDLDYDTLDRMRRGHPAWRLLRSNNAPLVTGFLHRFFLEPNRRATPQGDLAEALEDELFVLRERLGTEAFPRTAAEYLNDWADPERGWLRKYYTEDSDEPHFDLTPAAEKAVRWLVSLTGRTFVGTESRLRTLIELLRQIREGADEDPQARIAELERRRAAIEAEIDGIRAGELTLLDDTAVKDRFQQFMQMARELLGDFREVEHNFRMLDRSVRERIALWDGPRAALLDDVVERRGAIAESDQGRSFNAFWDFLMSQDRQEELTGLLDAVLALPTVGAMRPDARTRRVHYDWLEAGEQAQATVRRLSQQLRRFLDDQAWLENRRIMEILRGIEANALAVRDRPPKGTFAEVPATAARIRLPMERPLYAPPVSPSISTLALESGEDDLDTAALFAETVVDKARLEAHIRHALQDRSQVTLRELCEARPLEHGLAELVAYLQLADNLDAHVDEETEEWIWWNRPAAQASRDSGGGHDGERTPGETMKRTRLPRIIFAR